MRTKLTGAGLVVLALAAGACAFGAARIDQDRLAFGEALTQSWKEQFLLNVVRSRYADPPTLLDITSIINQYAVTQEVSVGADGLDPGHLDAATGHFLGLGRFENRPTVTYSPVRGEQYVRVLLTPVRPELLLSLIESGWSAETILKLCVKSMNGLRNRDGTNPDARPGDPGFDRVVELLEQIQRSGSLAMRLTRAKSKDDDVTVTLGKSTGETALELRRLLGIGPQVQQLDVVYSPAAHSDGELAILTRSIVEVMQEFASCVDVPEGDVTDGRAARAVPVDSKAPFRVRRSDVRPSDAFVTVRYRNAWYYVDDRDLVSKRSLNVALLVQSLQESSNNGSQPVVTVSTN